MKITFLQVEQAFGRAVYGESVRSIARSLGVSEGCLRFHFGKGEHPREVRRLAFQLFNARQAIAMLSADEQKTVDRLVAAARRATA